MLEVTFAQAKVEPLKLSELKLLCTLKGSSARTRAELADEGYGDDHPICENHLEARMISPPSVMPPNRRWS